MLAGLMHTLISRILGALLLASVSTAYAGTEVICSYVPSQNAMVNRIASGLGGAAGGVAAIMQSAGISAVAHSSGGYILTSAGGYIAGTMGAAAAVPVLITTVVVVGGVAVTLELTCLPKNHPDSIRKVNEITAEFNRAIHVANNKAIDVRDGTTKQIRKLNDKGIDMREHAVQKVKAYNDDAIEFRDEAARLVAKGKFWPS